MRQLGVWASLVSAVAIATGDAAQDPEQRFRAKVDLITVDVAAIDSRGRPVEDLRSGDFTVKVDGRPRPVVSAELIRVDPRRQAPSPQRDAISNNAAAPDARRIVIAVDQTLITPGLITPLLNTGSNFVGRLAANDHVAFIAFPEPGPRVDFTTDRARVRKAMETIVGQPAKRATRQFNISIWEALALTDSGERVLASSLPPPGMDLTQPPTMRRILERGCEGLTFEQLQLIENVETLKRCRTLIYTESIAIAGDARQDANISLRSLEALLKDLALIDGPKTMVVISAGLVNDNPSVLEEVARLAAAARTSISVIAVEPERDIEIRSEPVGQPAMSLVDRTYQMQGLEIIADSTGGTLHRGVAGSGAGIFERIERELSAWYLVAVERQPGDPDRQRVEVEVRRRGVTVRASKTIASPPALAAANRPVEDLLSESLSSSLAIPGIPLRVSTYAHHDPEPGKYRVRLAAQVGEPGEPAGEFAVGYVLADEKGRVVLTGGSRRTLSPPATGTGQPLHYDTALEVPPGTYSLRFGVVGREGRRGTVVHPIELPKFDPKEVAVSDLIVGNVPGDGEVLRPGVEPRITAGELAAHIELYVTGADAERVTVNLEIAEGIASPALATEQLSLRAGDQPSWRVATGVVDVTVAPGLYVARATVRRDGTVLRSVTRPITVVRDASAVAKARPRSRGVPMSPDMGQRTAAYVTGVVGGLANLVAREEFTLTKPDRRVVSDLLLVRYPGSQRDLIPYRDVSHVDGKIVPGRDGRLLDLFIKPTPLLRERARQIMAGADAHVPSAFNPLFALGFLQSDFQPRFQLTVNDAGPEWPSQVKAVTFVETGRPTLLRTGPFGDLDVATRGTAWIEEATGRILQTELQIGTGRSAPTMVTRFRLDDRLQVTVPDSMRTQNPDGTATYTNFRRFAVETDALMPTPTLAEPQR